jgi:pilus assembly protein Flp/PilA
MLRMYIGLQTWIASTRDREEGQALVEYALILALISVVAITVLTDIGNAVNDKLGEVLTGLS